MGPFFFMRPGWVVELPRYHRRYFHGRAYKPLLLQQLADSQAINVVAEDPDIGQPGPRKTPENAFLRNEPCSHCSGCSCCSCAS